MHRFRVNLKTFLGLAMPNQCCHAVTDLVDFLAGILGKKPQALLIPIYSTTSYYMIYMLQANLIHSLSSEVFENAMRAGGHFSYFVVQEHPFMNIKASG